MILYKHPKRACLLFLNENESCRETTENIIGDKKKKCPGVPVMTQ